MNLSENEQIAMQTLKASDVVSDWITGGNIPRYHPLNDLYWMLLAAFLEWADRDKEVQHDV